MKAFEDEAKEREIQGYKQQIDDKQKEIENQSKEMMKMKDERMDYEARVDDTFIRERKLQEEVV